MEKTTAPEKSMVSRIRVPAGKGRSFEVSKGQYIAVVDIHGGQCVDFWAIDAQNYDHYFSPPYSIIHNLTLQPKVGDTLVTNYRQPILTIMADNVGSHDMLYPACDKQRYLIYFQVPDHRSCYDNFLEAIAAYAWEPRPVPNPPFNIFMNTRVEGDGRLVTGEPRSKPGDKIILRAEIDVICVASSCPMDLTPTGSTGITDVEILVAASLDEINETLRA